jgi:hypothetical protein
MTDVFPINFYIFLQEIVSKIFGSFERIYSLLKLKSLLGLATMKGLIFEEGLAMIVFSFGLYLK